MLVLGVVLMIVPLMLHAERLFVGLVRLLFP
jgi:hypothetical protein